MLVLDLDPTDDPTARRDASLARHEASVHQLLEVREDLHGVHPMADLIYDAVRWSA